ncbi:MAG: DUF4326 domain-containing protein [Blastocatellales bacterium]
MITIVNRKTWRGESVYVGRPSVLGNPFCIGKDGERSTVISKYRRWLWNELQRGSGLVFDELHRLAKLAKSGDLILACWCFPEKCHAETIKAAVEWISSQSQQKRSETMSDNQNEITVERQCHCCGSYDGDPYAILSNGYCIPCDEGAKISCLETISQQQSSPGLQ